MTTATSKPKYQFTIGERELTFNERMKLISAIGPIQPQDKGKRVYLIDNGTQRAGGN